MRKIKSVKTKLLYTAGFEIIPIGTEGWKEADLWRFTSNFSTVSCSEEWILKRESLFAIEYEPEGFEFVLFPKDVEFTAYRHTEYAVYPKTYVFNINLIANSELNRLADWCDGQSEKDLPREYFVEYDDISLLTDWAHDQYFRHGLKFNSNDSASLFITELNKPENSDYKNYFIELLKKTRL